MKTVKLHNFEISNNTPFTLIAGPCQLESLEHSRMIASHLKQVCAELGINFIFKASFDKANRSSLNGKRGIGLEKGMEIFKQIKKEFDVPVVTDVHESYQCDLVKDVVDVIQIPAFLCRQTDLLLAAGKTGKVINVKKAQFLAPSQMKNVVEKIASTGNDKIMVTERGTSFGYGQLVVDPTGIVIMAKTGYPTVIDATHSVQQPGALGTSTGGDRKMVEVIARTALSTGVCSTVFLEVHEDPDNAPSDGPNSIRLSDIKELLQRLKKIDDVAKSMPVSL